ncbi:MAG TPA: polysaccharide biosynthesis tyrosine autokinase [Silvibacterium sp.]|nr:polysaccharide biosynthesis tyrosine autokinase [Silvibacterium sp.]
MSGALQQGGMRGRVLERGDVFAPARQEWTLRDLLNIFGRRRRILFGCVLGMCALATLYCVTATPHYLATGQIEVQKDSPGTLGLENSVTGGPVGDSDALDASMTLETEARILQSSTLALTVVKDLKLETTKDYFPARKRGVRLPAWLFFWRKPVEPMSVPLDEAPNRRYAVLKIFASRLKVEQVTGTRLINVSYSSPDPQTASAVVNRLIGALQEFTFQSRLRATAQTSVWLAGQLTGLKKQTEDLQQAADRLEQGTGIYGGDGSHNLVLARLEGLNGALAAAESNRILKQAVYEIAKSGDPEMISGLAGNGAAGASPAMTNSLSLLQTLRAQEAQVAGEMNEDDARYGSAYPKIAELRAEQEGIEKSIQEEIGRIGQRAHTDYEIAASAEDAARNSFEKQKEIANATNDRTVAYELAKQEADGSRDLYRGLLGKLKQAGVLEGMRSTNLTVVSDAMVPAPNHPHSPNVPLAFAAALAGGLFVGCAGALLGEATDESVRSIDELEQSLGTSLAGGLPAFRKGRWVSCGRRESDLQDAVRELRRAFAMPAGGPAQAMLITGAVPGNGKSKLAAALALSLDKSGMRVLLVDADLHSPSLHTLFHAAQASGLAEALASGNAAEVHTATGTAKLSLVLAGREATRESWDAADLLASPRMRTLMEEWRQHYDVVLLDSAPVLPVPDSAGLAALCDRTVLVVGHQTTTVAAAQRSYRMIADNLPETAALDVVVNGVPGKPPDYVGSYGHKRSSHGRKGQLHV